MIQFRCWHCNRLYGVANYRVGERLICTCQRRLRVPKRSGGSSRVRTLGDWLIETVLCGGGGAFLGASVAVLIVSQFGRVATPFTWEAGLAIIAVLTLLGFAIGTFGGMRGLDWIGRRIRDREQS